MVGKAGSQALLLFGMTALSNQYHSAKVESSSLQRLRGNSRGSALPLQPPQEGPGVQNAGRNFVLNRCFEALERADISQALETATATQAWPVSTLPAHWWSGWEHGLFDGR